MREKDSAGVGGTGAVMVVQDDWYSCYRDGWQGLIIPDAFAHPAKVSRGLAHRILDHCREEGWLSPGDHVLDPFAGIAGFALDTMRIGCHFVGIELEQKFVDLAQQNIALWHKKFHRLPNWGTAQVYQGDSRKLLTWSFAGGQVEAVVGSPPFSDITSGHDKHFDSSAKHISTRKNAGSLAKDYGTNPSNLGNMREGSIDAAISSPPFSGSQYTDKRGKDHPYQQGKFSGTSWGKPTDYDHPDSPGQLAAMREGSVDAAISSPPYSRIVGQGETVDEEKIAARERRHLERHPELAGKRPEWAGYGQTDGQLSSMPEGRIEAVVSSPPYSEGLSKEHEYADHTRRQGTSHRKLLTEKKIADPFYGATPGNLGNVGSPDTFWLASRQILEQLYACVRPGGHAVFVTKRYVRSGKIVEFSQQWAQLCEAVGFRLVHWHKAWLVEDYGVQRTTDNGDQERKVKRASFFRRLHEQKRPETAIDWEDALCFERLPLGRG